MAWNDAEIRLFWFGYSRPSLGCQPLHVEPEWICRTVPLLLLLPTPNVVSDPVGGLARGLALSGCPASQQLNGYVASHDHRFFLAGPNAPVLTVADDVARLSTRPESAPTCSESNF